MKYRASLTPLLILAFGSCLTACGGGSGDGGSAGTSGGGHAGTSAGGHAGTGSGGAAGTSVGGQAGTGTGGQAGTNAGGESGAGTGGQAGTSAGGQAGTSAGGQAGTSAGGQAGTSAGGQAGTSAGGHAGTSAGGQAGTSAGGQAGTSAGGHAGTGAGGSAGSAGGASGAGGALAACNNVVNGAAVIDKNHHAEAPPVMMGGPISDGTYFLTAMDKYNGETGTSSHQETWVYSGNTIQVVQLDGTRFSLTYVVSSTNALTFTITCPASQAGVTGVSPYTATTTQIVTVNSDDPDELHTFTRQ